jgi:predicted nucleic acid-binding protein
MLAVGTKQTLGQTLKTNLWKISRPHFVLPITHPGNGQRIRFKNSMRDALIALTAREHGMVLVTCDRNLEMLVGRHGIATKLI